MKRVEPANNITGEQTGLSKRTFRFLILLMIGLYVLVIAMIFCFSRPMMHSDSAFFELLANEQMKQGKLFPEGMCYSTVLFVRTPNLLMIPFIALTGNLMLAKEITFSILWIVYGICIWFCFSPKGDRNRTAALMAAILITIPYLTKSVEHEATDNLFFQGAYILILIDIPLVLGIVHRIFLTDETTSRKRKLWLYVCLLITVFVPLMSSVREDMIIGGPLILSLILFYYFEKNQSLAKVLKSRTCIWIILTTIAAILLGYALLHYFGTKYWPSSKAGEMEMVTTYGLLQSFEYFFNNLGVIFGNLYSAPIVSFGGIYKLANYVYELVIIFLVPLCCLFRYRKFDNRFMRFFIIFSWISNLAVFAGYITCQQWQSRYLLTIYSNDVFLFALVTSDYVRKRERFTAAVITLIIAMYAVCCHGYFWKFYHERIGQSKFDGLIAFLEEHDLTYGYASYWNAEVNTVLSNGRVQILDIGDHDDEDIVNGLRAKYDPQRTPPWLDNLQWYDASAHPGKSFVLLYDFEEENKPPEELEDCYYQLDHEILHYEHYTIVVFDDNQAVQALPHKKAEININRDWEKRLPENFQIKARSQETK